MPGRALRARLATAAGLVVLAVVLGLSFAAYVRPDGVLDFATLLQLCGLR